METKTKKTAESSAKKMTTNGSVTKMNAQGIINLPDRQDELMSLFYPDLWEHQKASENITAILNKRRCNNTH